MTDFLVWYFRTLSAWGAIEFFFKALLLMVLTAIPFVVLYTIFGSKSLTKQEDLSDGSSGVPEQR